MSYDPIIWFLGEALTLRRPTYVGDAAAMTVGPRQTFRAKVALLFAGHAAGLRMQTHPCQWLEIADPSDELVLSLQHFPVGVLTGPPCIRVFGLTPALLADILRAYGLHSLIMRPVYGDTAREGPSDFLSTGRGATPSRVGLAPPKRSISATLNCILVESRMGFGET